MFRTGMLQDEGWRLHPGMACHWATGLCFLWKLTSNNPDPSNQLSNSIPELTWAVMCLSISCIWCKNKPRIGKHWFRNLMLKLFLQECSTWTIPEVQTVVLGIFSLSSLIALTVLNGQGLMKAIRAHSCGCTADLATSHIAVFLPGQSDEWADPL